MPSPSNIDILPPFDVTGYATLTAAQLQQLVSGLIPQTDKGMIVVTTDVNDVPEVPDAEVTTKWQNYLWLRVSATMSTVYAWNVNALNPDNDLLRWIPVTISGIGPGDITTDMIADGAVTYAKLATNAVSGIKVADDGIWPAKLNSAGTVGQVPRIDASGILFEYFDPTIIANPTPADYNKLLAADNVGGFEYIAKSTVGAVVQEVFVEDDDIDDSAGTALLTNLLTHPTITMGKDIPGLTVAAFTPLNIGSTIMVDCLVNLKTIDVSDGYCVLALFKDDATNAVAATVETSIPELKQYHLRYKFVSPSLASIKFAIRFMSTFNATNYYNSEVGVAILDGLFKSSIRITETL